MKDLCIRAVDIAKHKGATYADARIVRFRRQLVSTEDERVSSITDAESVGIGVRVIADGAWGFAASATLSDREVERVAEQAIEIAKAGALAKAPEGIAWAEEPVYNDVFKTPIEKNPFDVSLEEKINLLLAINKELLRVNGIKKAHSHTFSSKENIATSQIAKGR